MTRTLFVIIGIAVIIHSQPLLSQANQQNRVIVLTDIEADPDDKQSLVRLLLYSNEIDIRGLVATTSVWQKSSVHPESIKNIIRAYDKVLPNLKQHASGFPTTDALMAKVTHDAAEYGMQGVGAGHDTPGSDWIIKELEADDERPLWISVWGGVNTLAQALYTIRETRTAAEASALISKLRVYTISDQDDSGNWIRTEFPDLFYIVSPGDDYGSATWSAINTYIEGIDNTEISNSWIADHVQQGHGPLGAAYPDVAYGMEGDTPAYLALIPNGLNRPEHPKWGGWGGRYELYTPPVNSIPEGGSDVQVQPETRAIWTNASDTYTPYVHNEYGRTVRRDTTTFSGNKVTLWRWRDAFQNDFAARMDWCTQSYDAANHPPDPALGHPEELTVRSGEGFSLDASGTTDPDGDNLSYLWFHYPEAGSSSELIDIASAENLRAVWVNAPEVDKEETAHFILQVTDKGTPPLTRYKRVKVTILPE